MSVEKKARERQENRLRDGRKERGRIRITSKKKWNSIERRWWKEDESLAEGGKMTSRRWTKGSPDEKERKGKKGQEKSVTQSKGSRRRRRKAEDQGRGVAENCVEARKSEKGRYEKEWVVVREGMGKSRQNIRWTLTKEKVKVVRRTDGTKNAHGGVWGKKARRI